MWFGIPIHYIMFLAPHYFPICNLVDGDVSASPINILPDDVIRIRSPLIEYRHLYPIILATRLRLPRCLYTWLVIIFDIISSSVHWVIVYLYVVRIVVFYGSTI